MIQVGIFTGYFPYALEETAKRIRELNFNTVQLDVTFKNMQVNTGELNNEKCKMIRDVFRDNNPVSYTHLTLLTT